MAVNSYIACPQPLHPRGHQELEAELTVHSWVEPLCASIYKASEWGWEVVSQHHNSQGTAELDSNAGYLNSFPLYSSSFSSEKGLLLNCCGSNESSYPGEWNGTDHALSLAIAPKEGHAELVRSKCIYTGGRSQTSLIDSTDPGAKFFSWRLHHSYACTSKDQSKRVYLWKLSLSYI